MIDDSKANASLKKAQKKCRGAELPLASEASTTIFDPKKARKRGEGELLVALCQHLK